MTVNTPALEELPYRAQVGYVINYANVKQGNLTPGVILGILHAKGVLDEISDEKREIAADVIERNNVD